MYLMYIQVQIYGGCLLKYFTVRSEKSENLTWTVGTTNQRDAFRMEPSGPE
jgi:hypothetical protein